MSEPISAYAVSVELTVAAGRNKTWKSLVKKTSDWWPATYFSLSGTKRFVIENRLGGRTYEDGGKKAGAIWGTVIGWLPPEKITFGFEMYPGWSGPGRSFVSISLTEVDGSTKMALEDHGICPNADKAAASLKEGWETLLGKHFKNYVENGKAKKAKAVKTKKEKKSKAVAPAAT
jgi:Activator of Hsp90 ATPase homolog 1-like protein